MVSGIMLRKRLHLPGLQIRAREKERCISCGRCKKVCPMGIGVVTEIKNDVIDTLECIQCGACIDNCPEHILTYGMIRKEKDNGK